MQKRGRTLAQFRGDLDRIFEFIGEERESENCALYRCNLGEKYISQNDSIVKNPVFESAIVKIQNVFSYDLTQIEKRDVIALRNVSNSTAAEECSAKKSMSERVEKRQK